jgi:hypothetical protein
MSLARRHNAASKAPHPIDIPFANVLYNITVSGFQVINRTDEKSYVIWRLSKIIINNNTKRCFAYISSHPANRSRIALISSKRPNALLIKQNVSIALGSKNMCIWKIFAPAPQRCAGASTRSHRRWSANVVRAQPEFENHQLTVAKI